jgi:tetratricopeptide (TPR) repeat protein
MEILKKIIMIVIAASIFSGIAAQDKVQEAFKNSFTSESDGKYSQAINQIKKVYDADSYEINIRLAWLSYEAGQYTESVSYYSKCIKLKPLSVEALLGLTYPASAIGNWEQVIDAYSKVLKIDENNYSANLRMGQIYLNRQEYKKADEYFQVLLNMYPFTYDVVLNTAWNNYYMGKFREAKVLFEKVMWLNPGDSSAQTGLDSIK